MAKLEVTAKVEGEILGGQL